MEEIAFPEVNLSAVMNPVPAIMSAKEFNDTTAYFLGSDSRARSLVSAVSQALMFSIVRNARPQHIVEIGTFKGGSTECLARGLEANGEGLLHTIGPFDSEHFLPVLKSWPDRLQSRVRFYPTDSMSFFMGIRRECIYPWFVFVDGCHDYEFALFDIQCAARSLSPGGFIVIDNVSQAGPYFAAADFLKMNPAWTNCELRAGIYDQAKAYDRERRSIIGTDFIVLRAPNAHTLNDRPRTFGELNWPAAKVQGVAVDLAAPQTGTLNIQCILRGFSDTQNVERLMSTSREIENESGFIEILFPKALALEGTWIACRVEPWFVWQGVAPLVLRDLPKVI